MKAALAKQGMDAVGSSPDEYAAHIKDESARNARLIKSIGLTLD
jgi:tripartite-type tricarboxylate transporter receptor subunit TctC